MLSQEELKNAILLLNSKIGDNYLIGLKTLSCYYSIEEILDFISLKEEINEVFVYTLGDFNIYGYFWSCVVETKYLSKSKKRKEFEKEIKIKKKYKKLSYLNWVTYFTLIGEMRKQLKEIILILLE